MTPRIVEGTVVSESRSLWILWERSTQRSDPRLVLDGIEDMVNRYPELNEVRFCCTFLLDSSTRLGGLYTEAELWFGFFLRVIVT